MAASLVLNGSRSQQTGSLYEGIPHSAEGVETFLIVGVGDDEEERENTRFDRYHHACGRR